MMPWIHPSEVLHYVKGADSEINSYSHERLVGWHRWLHCCHCWRW